ncbi:MAG: nucleotidyltransferase family protein [Prevotella sp.]|nr:nucleotidyltransferase family protein [Prevotella sp.]
MKLTERLFFELLQVAIGNRDALSGVPSPEEWEEIYETAKKQTMVGIAFKGVERLPQEQLPPRTRIRQWFVKADKIRKRNEKMNLECAKTCYLLAQKGFHSCILKGQANLRNSPTPALPQGGRDLGYYRTPGDIDVWTWSDSGKVSDVISFVKKVNPKTEATYHHADCVIAGETETEVHYRPSWMSAPWRNKVFQRFCNEHKKDIERFPVVLPDGRKSFFFVPSIEFDAVYQLVHIYRHLFYEGIGLRQMMDYWMVMKNLSPTNWLSSYEPPTSSTFSKGEGEGRSQVETMQVLKKLGMRRFAAAVMWVLAEVLDPDSKDWMLCEPNEKDGRFLLKEIMLAGNFGHEDERINVTKDHWLRWGLMKLRRNMKFLTSYPEEVICEPFFRIFHWMWRTFRLWRF